MFRRIFFHSLLAGILAAIAAIIYNRIYFFATQVNYSKVLNTATFFGLGILVCLVAGFIYWALISWNRKAGEVIFNFLFSMGSFACVMIPISMTLPLDVQFPELFPGLAVPMVFFPALAWFTIKPFFRMDPLPVSRKA